MEIGFFGDSITEGRIGASYLDLIRKQMPEATLLNVGRGGETVISLYHRIKEMVVTWDTGVVWIGVNDILVHVKWYFSLLKKMRKQPWFKGMDQFGGFYRKILDKVGEGGRTVLAVTPLMIGEDRENPWNRLLGELSRELQRISSERSHVHFVDLRSVFFNRLEKKKTSGYYLRSAGRVLMDSIFQPDSGDFNRLAEERGLYFTLDGIHLNTSGARLAAEVLMEKIKSVI